MMARAVISIVALVALASSTSTRGWTVLSYLVGASGTRLVLVFIWKIESWQGVAIKPFDRRKLGLDGDIHVFT